MKPEDFKNIAVIEQRLGQLKITVTRIVNDIARAMIDFSEVNFKEIPDLLRQAEINVQAAHYFLEMELRKIAINANKEKNQGD